ncbi:oligosaccharide flippase family protein [Ruegeria sp. 2205SS24-7]|uniref:oligosaccharide flippase family protein n=1 Tax=Ruegeria discodermiae TaxID=3064389 RepID=UPI0027413355|nr:oligosaccharide flippase family protein [Ruegeria sp. 2205SS24-7]MDP5221044.1 oligosaccharide flippase family protein [Ruegeria sp. 2205SS24-7]
MAANQPPTGRSARGFFVNVSSLVSARLFLALSQVLVLPIVARHLTVDEFALMAMAMSVVVFCSVLSDAGLGRSLIRAPSYDHEEWVSVFWLMVAVGVGLALIILAIGPLWAAFFEQPGLVPILAALAIVPLCQAVSAAPNAEVERRENYTGIAKVQTITTVVSLGLAVVLAILGAGVWALVAQQVSLAIVRLAGIVSLSRFRPNLTFKPHLIGTHLLFARNALAVSAISAIKAQSAIIAIGKFNGEAPLGLFSMSARFSRLPQFGLVGPVSTVVYVRMAKAQDDPARLVEIYLGAMKLMATLLFPALAMTAVAGTAIFTVMLSAEWAQVAPIFALSISGLTFEAIAVVLVACIFRATNRTDLHVRLSTESAILYITLVVAAAALSDVLAVAAAISVWGFMIVPRGWYLAKQVVPISLSDCLRALFVPVLMSGLMVGCHITLRHALSPGHVAEIALAGGILAVGLGLTVLLQRRKLETAVDVFRQA